MVRYRVLRTADIPGIQPVALKAWMFAYPRYGVPVSTIQRFVRERYSTESFQRYVLQSIQKGHSQFYVATDKAKIIGYSNIGPNAWAEDNRPSPSTSTLAKQVSTAFQASKSWGKIMCPVTVGDV